MNEKTHDVDATSKSATTLLSMAQRVHDDYVNDAEKRAEEIISEAEREAVNIVTDAKVEAQSLLESAQIEEERIRARIADLRNAEYNYRVALQDAANATLEQLEESTETSEHSSPEDRMTMV